MKGKKLELLKVTLALDTKAFWVITTYTRRILHSSLLPIQENIIIISYFTSAFYDYLPSKILSWELLGPFKNLVVVYS